MKVRKITGLCRAGIRNKSGLPLQSCKNMLSIARDKGYEVNILVKTPRNCDNAE